jgi:PLP dependent protein
MEEIKLNLHKVLNNIEKSANKSGRKLDDITTIVVTKNIDIVRINNLVSNSNIINLGESKVQEFLYKYDNIDKSRQWHIIGHLQKNKVKYIVDKVKMIQSVDSLALAKQIDKYAKDKNIISDILIQINISNEPTKYGLHPKEVKKNIEEIIKLTNVSIKGLMTIAPYVEKPNKNRELFAKMNDLFIDINSDFKDNISMKYLSMGMTNDYEVAIEEGSNMVRIGTAIFGNRY